MRLTPTASISLARIGDVGLAFATTAASHVSLSSALKRLHCRYALEQGNLAPNFP